MTALQLHDYQLVARDHLLRTPRGGLFLDMGLGKTATTLRALTPERLPALVTAPKRVAENVWATEAAKWRPDLRVEVASSRLDAAKRSRVLETSRADIVVVGRDNLALAVPHARRYRSFIIDELSGFKDRGSARWRNAAKLLRRAGGPETVWGLTGTPAPNGYMDLWAQVYLFDHGERLGKTLTDFRRRYFTPGRQLRTGTIVSWDIIDGAEAEIDALIEDLFISMDAASRLDLAAPTFNRVEVPMAPATRRAYRELKRKMVTDLELLGGGVHTAKNAAVLSSKLSQISAGFLFADDQDLNPGAHTIIHRDKARAVKEIVDGTGSPVLVLYRFLPERDLIAEALDHQVFYADTPDLQSRWNAGEIPVLLAHPDAVGHGLNLQYGGHTQVWSSLPWSLEAWQQTNKRLARQGQTKPVVIHYLETPASIDPQIKAVLDGKTEVQDALLDHLASPL